MSAGNTVRFTLSASEREAVQAWTKLRQMGPEAFDKALNQLARNSKRTAKDTEQSWTQGATRMAASFVSIQAGVNLIERGWSAVLQKMDETERKSRSVSLSLEQAGRRLAVQAGLSSEQEKMAIDKAMSIGQKYGTSGEAVASAFTQLVSSGGKFSDVTGGAGEALVQTAAASNLGLDAESLRDAAQSAALFLSSTGQDINTQNIRRLGVGSQALFQGTNFQLSELSRFAEESGQLKINTGASQEELLGTFALLRNQFGAAKASTAFRAFATKLVGLDEGGPQAEALGQIGLGVGDVDFVGESYQDVLARLTEGLSNADPAVAAQVRKKLFGEEGGAAAAALLQPGALGEIQDNIALQQTDTAFNAGLARATSGASAAVEKLKAQEQAALNTPGASNRAVYSQAMNAEFAERRSGASGMSNMGLYIEEMVSSTVFDVMTSKMGYSPESALQYVGTTEIRDSIQAKAMESLKSSIDANTRQLEMQNGNPGQQRSNAFENR